jgi:hypothetical protein
MVLSLPHCNLVDSQVTSNFPNFTCMVKSQYIQLHQWVKQVNLNFTWSSHTDFPNLLVLLIKSLNFSISTSTNIIIFLAISTSTGHYYFNQYQSMFVIISHCHDNNSDYLSSPSWLYLTTITINNGWLCASAPVASLSWPARSLRPSC